MRLKENQKKMTRVANRKDIIFKLNASHQLLFDRERMSKDE